jgi:tetratricopeptide (TPR) repeat protein
MTAETPRPPAARSRWPVLVVGGAVLAGVAIVGVKLATRPEVDAAARARLEAVIVADGDPLAPPACRAGDGGLVDRLARAAAWLHDSAVNNPRPQDRDALALLSNLKGGDASAEYWALLSRARLVVEPTPDGALAAARTAVQRCPGMAMARNALGGAEQHAHDDAAATAAYRTALTLAPEYVAPRFNLGLIALRNKDLTGAMAAFDAVLTQDPLHPRAHLARGTARLESGDLTGALDDLEQATLRHPSDPESWMLLGQARAASGAHKTAVEAFCKAKSLGHADAIRLCP